MFLQIHQGKEATVYSNGTLIASAQWEITIFFKASYLLPFESKYVETYILAKFHTVPKRMANKYEIVF